MAEVVTAVASDWLRPRLGRAWRAGRVTGTTPRAVYIAVTDARAFDADPGLAVGNSHGGWQVRPGPGRPGRRLVGGAARGRSTTGGDTPPVADLEPPTAPAVALEAPDAVGLPNGLVLTDDVLLRRVRRGDPVEFGPGGIRGERWSVRVQRWRRSRPVVGPTSTATLRSRLAGLAGPGSAALPHVSLPAGWPAPDARLVEGLGDLVAIVTGQVADPVDVAARLDGVVGYGRGSTPSGDDLVAGFVATVLALAPTGAPTGVAAVTSHVGDVAFATTTALSATLLLAAFDGAMARPAVAVVTALTAPDDRFDPRALRRAVDDLGRVGHTSGRDLTLGLLGAAHHLATAPARVGASGDTTIGSD